MDIYRITDTAIDIPAVLAALADPACGGQALFVGTVRNEFEGRASNGLIYEAYVPMAESLMGAIGASLKEAWEISHLVLMHRIGRLALGTPSVVVAVAAPHRDHALLACRAGIERIKAEVPIWKKELWAEGDSQWHYDPEPPATT